MKYFLFTSPATRDVFELLMYRHREWVRRALEACRAEVAESQARQGDSVKPPVASDERVCRRLAEKVEEFVDSLVYTRFSGLDDLEPLDGIVLEAFSQIDYGVIARAIGWGVEPGDPTTDENPAAR
ncbi:MAG: hypothetical protein SFU86_16810 [Pirellulaceae bacterium]|nr:hypothetical protein [Pirellulaceae bacterium]